MWLLDLQLGLGLGLGLGLVECGFLTYISTESRQDPNLENCVVERFQCPSDQGVGSPVRKVSAAKKRVDTSLVSSDKEPFDQNSLEHDESEHPKSEHRELERSRIPIRVTSHRAGGVAAIYPEA